MKALRLKVYGIVQGVWFRASTKECADHYRVSGWVRNAVDGSVEIHAQGAEDAMGKLLAWCRRGPGGARVDSVEVEDVEADPGLEGFVIRR